MSKDEVLAQIDTVIIENDTRAITPPVLAEVLRNIVNLGTFENNITVKLFNGGDLGKYHHNMVVPSAGKTAVAVITEALSAPAAPLASLVDQLPGQVWEIGQTIDIPLSISYTQNEGGSISSISLKRDGVQIATTSFYINTGVQLSGTPKVYNATVQYLASQLAAGSITTNSLSYRGYYKLFFGVVSANPTTSVQVRALVQNQFETNKSLVLNTGSTQTKFAVAIPANYSITQALDLDSLSANITANYQLINASFSVLNAGGSPVVYKLYVMTNSIPYTTNHRHQITIA